ncbi:MAG: hypothetical protein ACTHLC_00590, partial [Rhizobiaceae bacterium]
SPFLVDYTPGGSKTNHYPIGFRPDALEGAESRGVGNLHYPDQAIAEPTRDLTGPESRGREIGKVRGRLAEKPWRFPCLGLMHLSIGSHRLGRRSAGQDGGIFGTIAFAQCLFGQQGLEARLAQTGSEAGL